MRNRITCLALVILMASILALTGCGGSDARFELSNLIIAPASPYVNDSIAISIDVTNAGGKLGTYTVALVINDETVENRDVSLEGEESKTVTFNYAAAAAGLYYITIGDLNGALQVQDTPEGYWSTSYKIAGGKVVLRFSLFGATPEIREIPLSEDQGLVTLLINRNAANGIREVVVPKDTWYLKPIFVDNCVTGVDMTIDVSLTADGSGWLYTQDNVGDVDVASESISGRTPVQVNTIGDGTADAAGSMILEMPLLGYARTTAGQKVDLSLDLIFTTGRIFNQVTRPGKGIDGAEMESSGIPFAEDGGPAPYIGTIGTITTTGTGDCLNLRLAGFETDFQAEITLELVPE
ncbi:MAG: CARDB domain-containing protein [Dehalococcoidia bacterium]|jgi:hypothetical protein